MLAEDEATERVSALLATVDGADMINSSLTIGNARADTANALVGLQQTSSLLHAASWARESAVQLGLLFERYGFESALHRDEIEKARSEARGAVEALRLAILNASLDSVGRALFT